MLKLGGWPRLTWGRGRSGGGARAGSLAAGFVGRAAALPRAGGEHGDDVRRSPPLAAKTSPDGRGPSCSSARLARARRANLRIRPPPAPRGARGGAERRGA